MSSPCYKCGKRTMTCHDTCEKYAKYDAENKSKNERNLHEKMIEDDAMHSPARDQRVKKYAKRR